jgi:DNA-directed RNA polymerase subunit beta'
MADQGIATVGDLKGRSEADLLMVPGIGAKAIEEVENGLAQYGYDSLDDYALA